MKQYKELVKVLLDMPTSKNIDLMCHTSVMDIDIEKSTGDIGYLQTYINANQYNIENEPDFIKALSA